MNIYTLQSNTRDYSSFIQRYNALEEMSIMNRASMQRWHDFGSNYTPVFLDLQPSDTRKKNYNFDISCSLKPFHVFSQRAINTLYDILEARGEFLEVITASKQKKFMGYYPTRALKNCFCKNQSTFKEYDNGFFISKPVLIKENITDEYLFTLEEDTTRVYITDKFKDLVENNSLSGFDFSTTVAII